MVANDEVYAYSKERPPVRIGTAVMTQDTPLSNGCVIHGSVIHSILSPGVRAEAGAVVRDSVTMNDTVVGPGAVMDHCVLDKEIVVGAGAQVGVGDDDTPNLIQPTYLDTGITIAGKHGRRHGAFIYIKSTRGALP
jgi:glucose-1-phosphate adenylyltransferase